MMLQLHTSTWYDQNNIPLTLHWAYNKPGGAQPETHSTYTRRHVGWAKQDIHNNLSNTMLSIYIVKRSDRVYEA